MIPSPFLTDQQWLRIEKSYHAFREKMDSDRRRERKKTDFPARLLFEAIFIKFAFDFRWEDLPRIFHGIHPDLPVLSRWKCSSFYGELYNSGFLQGVYRQLFLHLRHYGDYPLEGRIIDNCFKLDGSAVFLAPGQPLTWQNFTALLLLQRAYHNFRIIQREGRD